MHFDSLKLCAPGTRFLTAIDDEPAVEVTQPATTTSDVFGQDMELINPRLNHNLPHLYPLHYTVHWIAFEFGTNSTSRGAR